MSGAESPQERASSPGPTIGRRDGARVAAATLISAGSGYVILVVAARVLLPIPMNTLFVTFWSTLFACFGVLSGMSIETTRAVTASTLSQEAPGVAPGAPGRVPRLDDHRSRPRVIGVGAGVGAAAGLLLAATSPWWASRLFPEHTPWLAALVCGSVAAYSAHMVVVGSLAGHRSWRAYSGLIGADSLARLGLVLVAVVAVGGVVGLATGTALAALTWAGYLVFSPEARRAAMTRVDSPLPTFLRRTLAASTATGASALLVVGFPILLSVTTEPEAYAHAAPLLLAITLTRAPLMIPLNAYQGVAVSHFVQHRSRGLRALVPLARAVVLVGVAGAGLAWLVGPWLIEIVLRPEYRISGLVLAGLTLAATALALLTLTGALCQALVRHGAFVGGWAVAVAVAVLILMVPLGTTPRAVLALSLGPLVGIAVHLWALRPHAVATEPRDADAATTEEDDDRYVTVCMTTHNGAAYVVAQLTSVLAELGPDDEVVVVDDASSDDTVARIHALGDPRVRILESSRNRGYVRAFERALRHAGGRWLLLCDQDDVWRPGRVAPMVRALERAEVVATNLATLGGPPRIRGPYGQPDWRLRASHSRRSMRNIVGILVGNRPYYGCAIGIRREALSRVLPFPEFLDESHDLWIALYGNVARSMEHLEIRSVERRFHGGNASTDRPRAVPAVVRSRLMLVRSLRELRRRARA